LHFFVKKVKKTQEKIQIQKKIKIFPFLLYQKRKKKSIPFASFSKKENIFDSLF
jgi:hypothetical protein